MKEIKTFIVLIILAFHFSTGKSQELSAGFFNGLSLSDIHGNDISGYWKFKPGPVTGVNIDYSFNKVLGLQTGLNYSAIYYEYKSYLDGNLITVYNSILPFYPREGIVSFPYYYNEDMNFTYLSFPLQLRVSIPSKPQLDLSAGMFYSSMQDYKYTYSQDVKHSKNDFGYIYSAGLSYPLAENLKFSITTRYLTGRKNILENRSYRNGSVDFSIGIAYNGFLRKSKDIVKAPDADSTNSKISITYYAGEGLIWNSAKASQPNDASGFSNSFGFRINFPLASGRSFQTGLSFEQTGYTVNDSCYAFFSYYAAGSKKYYVDAKVAIDYITIPALLNFNIGKSEQFYINTGPYFGARLNARSIGKIYQETKSSSGYTLEEITIHDDLTSAIKNCDFGWIASSGVTVPFSDKLVVDFGLQFKTGLVEVFNKKYFTDEAQAKNTIRNSVLSFRIGLRVPVLK